MSGSKFMVGHVRHDFKANAPTHGGPHPVPVLELGLIRKGLLLNSSPWLPSPLVGSLPTFFWGPPKSPSATLEALRQLSDLYIGGEVQKGRPLPPPHSQSILLLFLLEFPIFLI